MRLSYVYFSWSGVYALGLTLYLLKKHLWTWAKFIPFESAVIHFSQVSISHESVFHLRIDDSKIRLELILPKHLYHTFYACNEGINFLDGVVEREGGTNGAFNTQAVHEGFGTMVTGANRNALLVE